MVLPAPSRRVSSKTKTMEELVGDLDLRFVFVGGKGGVGKTTTSASLATCFAQRPKFNRVLLISTDPAHSLGDAFMQKFTPGVPTKITDLSLDVLEVDPGSCLEDEVGGVAAGRHAKKKLCCTTFFCVSSSTAHNSDLHR